MKHPNPICISATLETGTDVPEILPCPFCGGVWGKNLRMFKQQRGKGYDNCLDDEDAWAYYVSCGSCGALGGWSKANPWGAGRKWNSRCNVLTSLPEGYGVTIPCDPFVETWAIFDPEDRMKFDIGPSPEMAWRSAWLSTCNGPDWDAAEEYRQRLEKEGWSARRIQILLIEAAAGLEMREVGGAL